MKKDIIICILVILLLGLGGYLAYDKLIDKKEIQTCVKGAPNIIENNDTLSTFYSSKSINTSGESYTLATQGNAGIFITVDSTQKVLTFSYTPTKVVNAYNLTWASTKDTVVNSEITFDKKIIDVFFGCMGQSSSGDTLFILLEDGSVEYIPIVHMFNHA